MAMAACRHEISKPKAYVYDHCPYCIRVRMILGLKSLDHVLVYVETDDEETPVKLVGSKGVPIWEEPKGGVTINESLDIVRRIDNQDGKPMLAEASGRADLNAWHDRTALLLRQLCFPRWAAAPLPEFSRKSSREWWTSRKEASIGKFSDHLANTPALIATMEAELQALETLLASDTSVNTALSYDDIVLFPKLRGLTLVKDLKFPPKVAAYMAHMSEKCDIHLYYSMAKL
eukprot:jgi/Mesvir1/6219/Mv00899-RA.1